MQEADKMAKARSAIASALGGKTTRELGVERERKAVAWIYRWGWTSPKILQEHCGDNRNGLVSRLEKKGLLVKTKTAARLGLPHLPVFILTLTDLGVMLAERDLTSAEQLVRYEIDPFRVNQKNLTHDHVMQAATSNAVKAGRIAEFKTPQELAQLSELNIKQPDCVWIAGQSKIGIEVELTGKWDRALDQFVRACLLALAPGKENSPPRLNKILLVSDSQALLERYKKNFQPGSKYSRWIKNEKNRQWEKDGTYGTVPDWVKEKLTCMLI